ncbi:MAG: hypothetical protein O3C19_04550 [Bacteroidetes bacterium]|nr:hypothetical protein [Bacteroidota bacterium]
MLPIFTPIITMLASKGMDLLSSAVENGADKAIDFVKEKTGINLKDKKEISTDDFVKLKQLENNPETRLKLEELAFKNKVEDNRHSEAIYNKAHETYQEKSTMSDEIARQIIKRNLPIIAILVTINVGLVYFMKDEATLIAIASNIIGVTIGNLFSERQAVVNFFMGSSIGSKEKDKLLKV